MTLRERREAIVRKHIHYESEGRAIDRAIGAFAHGATHDVVPLEFTPPAGQELTHPSSQAAHGLLTDLTTRFPNLELVPERVHHADDALMVEGRTRATHLGPWNGIEPTGKTIDVRAMVFSTASTARS
jgi:SnoaL-like polyketide cyclase